MLTSVVHIVHNSVRRQRGAGGRLRHPVTPSILSPRDLPRTPQLVRWGGFLIANPRLEICASPTKQSTGAKSNRGQIAFPAPDSSPNRRGDPQDFSFRRLAAAKRRTADSSLRRARRNAAGEAKRRVLAQNDRRGAWCYLCEEIGAGGVGGAGGS